MTINKYRVHCTTDSTDEHVLATAEPTQCPTNAGHSIDAVTLVAAGVSLDDGTPKDLPLADHKTLKINAIDGRTEELIAGGFVYASKTFSLSSNAQAYWNGLGNLTGNGLLTEPTDFPLRVNTLDDTDGYDIVDIADAVAVFGTAAATLKAHLASGTALKDSVRAATDIAGVDAVVDTR